MRRLIVLFGLLFSLSSAFAANIRFVPNDLIFVQIREVDMNKMEIRLVNANDGFIKRIYKSARTVKMTSGIRIKDENNRWVLRNKLLSYKGRVVGVRFTNAGQLNEVMILTDEEIESNIDRIKEQNWKGEIRR